MKKIIFLILERTMDPMDIQSPNILMGESGDRINRENVGQKFVHGSDDEGSYENINEKDVGYNTNRIARNSSDEHPSFQRTVDDFRDSDSEIERGERNYLPQSKHRKIMTTIVFLKTKQVMTITRRQIGMTISWCQRGTRRRIM